MPYDRPQDSSPKKKTVSLYAPSIRRIDNSSDKNMFEFVGYLNVKALGEIEPMLPLDANPRLPNKKFLDMNNDLINDRYEGLVSNLTSNDDFDLFKYACNGLTIYASDGFYNNDTKELVLTFDNRHGGKDGLANGNHVYQAIRTMVKQERVRDDYEVFLRVIVKMPDPYKPASIEGNNTGLEIQENSVLDYKGEFDWIKAQLEKDNFAYKGRIGYFEGHPNTLIDIRDIRELSKTGKIKIAKHMPRGMLEFWLDPESPYCKKDITPDKTKVLYCASNWRSALATKSLQEMGFDNVCHIKGGFQALVDAGFKVEKTD